MRMQPYKNLFSARPQAALTEYIILVLSSGQGRKEGKKERRKGESKEGKTEERRREGERKVGRREEKRKGRERMREREEGKEE